MEKNENGERYYISGERLKIARTMRGLSQDELAQRVGVGRMMIHHAETGARVLRADVLAKVCDTLDVDACWMLGVQPRDYIWDGMIYRTSVETLPASTGEVYTPITSD